MIQTLPYPPPSPPLLSIVVEPTYFSWPSQPPVLHCTPLSPLLFKSASCP